MGYELKAFELGLMKSARRLPLKLLTRRATGVSDGLLSSCRNSPEVEPSCGVCGLRAPRSTTLLRRSKVSLAEPLAFVEPAC